MHTTSEPNVQMGAGECTVAGCGCQGWTPDAADKQCIGQNSAGGSCNHNFDEHN